MLIVKYSSDCLEGIITPNYMFNVFKFFKSHSLMNDELRRFILFKGEHYSRSLDFPIHVT